MWAYRAPLEDMRFVIERVLDGPASWAGCPAFAEVDSETNRQILEGAGRFAAEVLVPLNASGDLEGCTLDREGSVRTPTGFPAAYRAFVEGGWPALPCDPAWGGQGLPLLLDAAVREMLSACNHAWTMYPDLLHGAYETIEAHGSEGLKARYLEKIATGEWLVAMALTEPQAGSDLGAVRTHGTLEADGSLRISGNKIFISGAEHDLTGNIVHLVLFRLPDAPAGTKGLSLALVPKLLADGSRNAVHCDGLEKKMGIKGSATCAVRYEGATGWLVGAAHRGLAAMFVMMNSARLHVGLQGLGHMEMATQNASRYARERVQMRAPAAAAHGAAHPIARHPAMRRTLARLQAMTEGARVVAYRAAQLIDEAHHHADAAHRARAAGLAALLTPVVKAFLTHHGFQSASAALQVYGGYGYVHDYGIEQSVRDSRIAMIYEGTNEIQAIDLVVRKVLADRASFDALLEDLDAEARRGDTHEVLRPFAEALRAQCDAARTATAALEAARTSDPEAPYRVADDHLAGMGHLMLAWAWAASARAALGLDDEALKRRKLLVARFGVDAMLPDAGAHWQRVRAVDNVLPDLDA